MNLTSKQKAILALIVKGNPDGPIDLDQLIERIPYVTSKQSMQFSVRALTSKGLIEKGPTEVRRERARRTFRVTPLGQHWANLVCPRPVPMSIDEVMDDSEIEEMERALGLA